MDQLFFFVFKVTLLGYTIYHFFLLIKSLPEAYMEVALIPFKIS